MIVQVPRPTPPQRLVRKALMNALGVLATPHHPDRYLELADPMLATTTTRARITDVDRSSVGSITLTLRAARPVRLRPGQCMPLAVVVDGVRQVRTFSPTEVPGSAGRGIVLTVGFRPGGKVSRHLFEHAAVGDIVELGEAGGDFVLPAPAPQRLLFVSGGTGITPVLSMLSALATGGYAGAATVVHYARTAGHVPRRDELEALAARPNIEVVLAHTRGDGGHLRGRFERAHLDAVVPWFASTPTYACGPAGLVERIRAVYTEADALELLHTESFEPPVFAADPEDASGTVSFVGSGVRTGNTGGTLLEQAECAGLAPDHGCRMGICHTCTAIRVSGRTRDVRTGELDSEPGKRICICVNAPVGDVAVDI